MKQITLLVASLLFAGASLFAADPQLLNMAQPDAQMYAGINVELAKTSQFGQFLLSSMPMNGDFETFIDSTGFDPRRDLREILIATSGMPAPTAPGKPAPMTGLFLAKGTFNIPQILAAAAKEETVKVSTYAGANLLTFSDHGGSQALGLIDGSTVVAGDLASVQGALDRRNATNVIDPAIMARINQLSTTEDAWSLSTHSFAGLSGVTGGDGGKQNPLLNSAVLQGIQQASGGVKFGSTIAVTAQAIAKDAADAGSLGDVVKLFAQMIQVHTSQGGTGVPPVAADLLKTLVVTTDGATVNVSLSLPEDQIEALIKMGEAHVSHEASHI